MVIFIVIYSHQIINFQLEYIVIVIRYIKYLYSKDFKRVQ